MISVLLNPAARGGHEDMQDRVETVFREAHLEARIYRLDRGEDPSEVARHTAKESSAVVAAGGDGTISSIAAALADTDVALGVLPLGTLNHFARDLGIPLDLKDAVATIARGHRSRVDVGRVNDRIFLNNASIGLYPNIVELRDELRRKGQRKWTAFVTATYQVLWTYRGITATVTSPYATWRGRTPFVFVGNNPYTLDGPHLGERPSLTGGQIVAYVAPRFPSRRLPLLFARALVGRARRSGSFEVINARELEIALPSPHIDVALDGELVTMSSPLRFRIDPRALTVFRKAD